MTGVQTCALPIFSRIHQIKLGPSWMDSISLFLEKDVLPEEKTEADKIRRKGPRFWLSEDKKLYKHSFSGPYLLCVHPEVFESLLVAKHAKRGAGICQEMRSMSEVCA